MNKKKKPEPTPHWEALLSSQKVSTFQRKYTFRDYTLASKVKLKIIAKYFSVDPIKTINWRGRQSIMTAKRELR